MPLESLEDAPQAGRPSPSTHEAKARLVVLGFQDPDIDTLARDSPTLGRRANASFSLTLPCVGHCDHSTSKLLSFKAKPRTAEFCGLSQLSR